MTQIKDRAGEPGCQPAVRGPGGFRNGGYFKWLTSCVACKPARAVAGRALAIAQQLLPCYLAGRICAQRRNSVRHPSFRWPYEKVRHRRHLTVTFISNKYTKKCGA